MSRVSFFIEEIYLLCGHYKGNDLARLSDMPPSTQQSYTRRAPVNKRSLTTREYSIHLVLGFDRLRARLLRSFIARRPSHEGTPSIVIDADEK